MLLRPFGAMNGCVGTAGARTRLGRAGAPMNAGTLFASGPSGIGCAGTAAYADAAVASSSATTAATVVSSRERRTERAIEDIPTSPPQVWLGDEIYRAADAQATTGGKQE